jgi:c(7)-type cytochrome triheme protein
MKLWMDMYKVGNRVTIVALFLFYLVIAASCSTSTRQIFFDIQPPSAEEIAEKNRQENERREATLNLLETQQNNPDSNSLFPETIDEDTPRPDIESLGTWEEVLEELPKDYKKKADWSAAIEQGLIRPRSGADSRARYATMFKYDFIIAADVEKPKNEGYFPHSAHTEWLGCKNCHMSIYPYKRNPATMKEMRAGKSCGTCHGSVAFSLKQCKRCHLNR